mgnify:FL=1|jgi:hypothetical protein
MLSTPTKSPQPFNSISKKEKYEILVDSISPRKNIFDGLDSDSDMEVNTSDFKLAID